LKNFTTFYCRSLVVIIFSLTSCETQDQKQERLVKQNCASCHAFPEPDLLDKKTWEKTVLPEMAFRMGLDLTGLNKMTMEDQSIVLSFLPDEPMVTREEWELIKQYYATNAPDSLHNPAQSIKDTLILFEAVPHKLHIQTHATVTLIKSDTLHDKIYIGHRPGKFYQLSKDFAVEDSLQLKSAPSKMEIEGDGSFQLLLMGIMDPNEQAVGKLASVKFDDGPATLVLDSLQRPVDFVKAHLNDDRFEDYVVCEFGNLTGALTIHEGLHGGRWRRHIIQNLSGARRVIVKDFDGNGMNDIMALMTQGDEKIILLYNQGSFQFRVTTLLRFNPAFGSSYFEIDDFNGDGKFDILYTNGDNADYSGILKPYHGVRLFLNSGTNEFKESWFYPLHGAAQTRTADFDKDGDLDIAAVSFFPEFKKQPEHGFVYLENTGSGFKPYYTPLAAKGRWITLEISDIDNDQDIDIMLGSLAFPTLVPKDLTAKWGQDNISILLLRNKLR
jgi:hypothetical protein